MHPVYRRTITKKLMPPRTMTRIPTNPSIYDECKREQIYKIEIKSLNFNLVLQHRRPDSRYLHSEECCHSMLHLFSLGVIYYWVTPDDQIRMLYVYPKSKQADLTPDQLAMLKSIIERW
jgi:hypothetical protein